MLGDLVGGVGKGCVQFGGMQFGGELAVEALVDEAGATAGDIDEFAHEV